MFGEQAAACCDAGTNKNGGVALPARLLATPMRTIAARDTTFPMRDPYSPVVNTRAPVPGLTAFPGRYNRLGRKYYGLNGGRAGKFKGFGFGPDIFGDMGTIGTVGSVPITTQPTFERPGSSTLD